MEVSIMGSVAVGKRAFASVGDEDGATRLLPPAQHKNPRGSRYVEDLWTPSEAEAQCGRYV
jgi:hypothetical protein